MNRTIRAILSNAVPMAALGGLLLISLITKGKAIE